METRIFGHRGASGYAPENTLEAFSLAVRILTHDAQLPVQQANPPLDGDGFAGSGIVPGDDEGCFPAGDLQPPGIDILPPAGMSVLRKDDLTLRRGPRLPILHIKDVFPLKPRLVQIIVHPAAQPCGRLDLAVLSCSLLLLLLGFQNPGLYAVLAHSLQCNRSDLPTVPVVLAQSGVTPRRPDDIPLHGSVLEQDRQNGPDVWIVKLNKRPQYFPSIRRSGNAVSKVDFFEGACYNEFVLIWRLKLVRWAISEEDFCLV